MEKNDKTGATSSLEDTKTLGRAADPEIKSAHPQVSDKAKLAGAISSIEDLSARLARLDSQDGPFGASTSGGGKPFDGLLDDIETPKPSAAPVAPQPEPIDAPRAEKSETAAETDHEDELITTLIGDDAYEPSDDEADLDEFFQDARIDTDERHEPTVATPTNAGDGFESAVESLMTDMEDEDILDIMDEDIRDPIDDILDAQRSANTPVDVSPDRPEGTTSKEEENGEEASMEDDGHASPFSALFSRVEIDFEDIGSDDDVEIKEYDPEDDLFFDTDEEHEVPGTSEFTGAFAEHGSVAPIEEEDINNSLQSFEDDTGEKDDDTASSDLNSADDGPNYDDHSGASDLPQLTMEQDDGLYAPGTSYNDEELEPIEDEATDDDESLDEKDDEMTISTNTPSSQDDHLDEDTQFSSSDLDDLLDEDVQGDDQDEVLPSSDWNDDEWDDEAVDAEISGEDETSPADTDAVLTLFPEDRVADEMPEDLAPEQPIEEAETIAPPAAKKRGSKALVLAAVSVLAISGAGGYAYMNGMLPAIDSFIAPGAQEPVRIADAAPEREMEPITPVDVDMAELGEDTPALAEIDLTDPMDEIDPIDTDITLNDPQSGSGELKEPDVLAEFVDPPDPQVETYIEPVAEQTGPEAPFVDIVEMGSPLLDAEEDMGDFEIPKTDDNTAIASVPIDLIDVPDESPFVDVIDGGTAVDQASDEDVTVGGLSEFDRDPVELADIADPAKDDAPETVDVAEAPIDEDELTRGEDIDLLTPPVTSGDEAPAEGENSLAELADVIQQEEVIAAETADADLADMDDPTAEIDPLAALAAEIDAVGNPSATDVDVDPEVVVDNSVFVEEERVIAIEEDVSEIGDSMTALTEEMKKLNTLILQSLEADSASSKRIEANERSLRATSAVLADLSTMKGSLDQTQVVLLDIAARVGSLEAANPADREEVTEQIREMKGEIKKLSANMAIIARMTVNGVTALTAEGASTGESGVRTSTAKQPSAGNDMVFSNDQTEAPKQTAPSIPSDVSKGDYVEGYGYVLDVVPASGGQKLVVMENGSLLIPN